MCLAIPLKIIEIDNNKAVGEYNGVRRNIRLDLLKNIGLGDYVMVHAGFAIEKLQHNQAKETLEAFSEVEEALNR